MVNFAKSRLHIGVLPQALGLVFDLLVASAAVTGAQHVSDGSTDQQNEFEFHAHLLERAGDRLHWYAECAAGARQVYVVSMQVVSRQHKTITSPPSRAWVSVRTNRHLGPLLDGLVPAA